MVYTTSKYNYFVSLKDYKFGYNFLTKSLLKINKSKLISNLLINEGKSFNKKDWLHKLGITQKELGNFIQNGFLIKENSNEIAEIKYEYRKSLYDSSSLQLTVMPTLNCNFDCPYCFEFKRKERMSEKTSENLLKWIESNAINKKLIHISWFGGEPLLEKSIIKQISERLIKICEKNGCTYTSSITTNGFLLNDDIIRKLDSYHINYIQITFDGDKYFHDKYRFLKNGKGTFDILHNNLINCIKKKNKDCKVTVRLNCTDFNYKSIIDFLERFPLYVRKRTGIFFRWIFSCEAKNFKQFSNHLTGEKAYKNLSVLYSKAKALGWNVRNPNNKEGYNYCEVDFLDHYLVGPDGSLFLCSHTMDKKDSIGNINRKKSIIFENKLKNLSEWYSAEPFGDKDCVQCKLLPVCLGGCRKERINGNKSCIDEKKSIKEFVINIIQEKFPIN
jgi:uncharacterized protein